MSVDPRPCSHAAMRPYGHARHEPLDRSCAEDMQHTTLDDVARAFIAGDLDHTACHCDFATLD